MYSPCKAVKKYNFCRVHCKLKPYFYITAPRLEPYFIKSKAITIIISGFYTRLVLQESLKSFSVDISGKYQPKNVVVHCKQRSNNNDHHFVKFDRPN